MKILICGSDGQLGKELRKAISGRHPEVGAVYTDVNTLDITDRESVETFLRAGDFTHVVNCAGYTAVDRAEEDKALCNAVNADGPGNLARLADELGFKLLHISTDYVFDGRSPLPYGEDSKPNPLNVYGTTKRKGETALLGLAPDSIIIRTAWLYSPHGANFVKTMLRLAYRGTARVNVVYDQSGAPTSATDLTEAITEIIFSNKWKGGIYHYSNEGVTSWYDFAQAIFDLMPGKTPEVHPIKSEDYPTAATRPAYSVLDHSRIRATYGIEIPYWRHSLQRDLPRIIEAVEREASEHTH